MINLHNISLTYNEGTVLENKVFTDFSLDIPAGQYVSIIGANGSGKSSLLSVVTGQTKAQQGKIIIDEQDVTSLLEFERASYIAHVFQNPLLGTCAEMSIAENMALALMRGKKKNLRSWSKAENIELFKSRIATLNMGLENRLADQIGLLSGGQRQALSLIMLTLAPSRALLLDEHTAALDPRAANYVLKLTQELTSKFKLTTLMVTHSMTDAIKYGDRLIMLEAGKIIWDIQGEQKQNLQVQDLIARFSHV